MKVVFADSPMFNVNGKKIYMDSERCMIGETFQQWLKRKWDYIVNNENPKFKQIKGFYIYDFQPIGGIIGALDKAASIIRYAYIVEEE